MAFEWACFCCTLEGLLGFSKRLSSTVHHHFVVMAALHGMELTLLSSEISRWTLKYCVYLTSLVLTFCLDFHAQYCMGYAHSGLQSGQSLNVSAEETQTWSKAYQHGSFCMCTLEKLWSLKCGLKASGRTFFVPFVRTWSFFSFGNSMSLLSKCMGKWDHCLNLQGYISGEGERTKPGCAIWLCGCPSFNFSIVN